MIKAKLDPDMSTGLPGVEIKKPKGVRIVVTADNHLRMTCMGSAARGEDFFRAAMSVVTVARDVNADAILNNGDMFNTPESLPKLQQQLAKIDRELQILGIPMYVIQGNHDFAEPSWIKVQQDTPRLNMSGKPTGVQHLDGVVDIRGLQLLGIPFLAPDDLRTRLNNLRPEEQRAVVLAWHGPVLEFAHFPTEGIVEAKDFSNGTWGSVLLGDIHKCEYRWQDRQGGKSFLIGYPGATELCKRDEPLEHTCTVMDLDPVTGQCLAMSHVPVAHRKVLPLRIDHEDEIAQAVTLVTQTAKQHPDVLVLARYNDSVPMVRHAIQAAAGPKAIVRADSYSGVQIPLTQERVDAGGTKKPQDYLTALKLPSGIMSLCATLMNPDSEESPAQALKVYCGAQATAGGFSL